MKKDGSPGGGRISVQRMKSGLKGLGTSMLDLFLPQRCAGCGNAWMLDHKDFWCMDCIEKLPWISSPLCPRCGRPYPDSPSSPDHLCGDCLLSASPIDAARSSTSYTGVVRDRIHQLKFGCRLEWAPALADLMARTAEREGLTSVQMLIPVPLHAKRLKERGFNQSGILSRVLGKRLGIPCRHDVLERRNRTQPQTRLSREERLTNVRGAFHVSQPSAVTGQRILLIDDVFTTGTTLGECARMLKAEGAEEVRALTVARTLLDWRESTE